MDRRAKIQKKGLLNCIPKLHISGIIKTLKDNEDSTVVQYIRQACAATVMDELFQQMEKDWILDELIDRNIIGYLIYALSNKKYAESQRNASV